MRIFAIILVVAVVIATGSLMAACGGETDMSSVPATAQPLGDTDEDWDLGDDLSDFEDESPEVEPAPPTKAEYKAACKKVAFRKLEKDAELMVGKKVRLHGQVFQIQDAGSGMYHEGFPGDVMPRTFMLVAVTSDGYGYWSDNVAVAYEGRLAKVYGDDVITVWGEVAGKYSYESVAGYSMTVPAVEAKYVSK